MDLKKEGKSVKLKWLEFENLKTGLKIERINFNDDITLLVGLSGVGKTEILRAVEYSLRIAVNKNIKLEPSSAILAFEVAGKTYEWQYHIEVDVPNEVIIEEQRECHFLFEKLTCGNEILFLRDVTGTRLEGYERVPMPKKDESLLVQYAEDGVFKELIQDIKKLYPIDVEIAVRRAFAKEAFGEVKSKVQQSIKIDKEDAFKLFSHLPVVMKLYIIKNYYLDLYVKVFDAVKELFMEIEDIDIAEEPYEEVYVVAIKVYGKKLLQHEISNGMLKTIYYIIELFTMSDDSLVLIDEFENGLGVNCIDILSEMLINERNDLQFVITSHHPKIINGIPKEKWKIIDRDIALVKNVNSTEYGVGNSQHDAYFNLINRWQYEGKI